MADERDILEEVHKQRSFGRSKAESIKIAMELMKKGRMRKKRKRIMGRYH